VQVPDAAVALASTAANGGSVITEAQTTPIDNKRVKIRKFY
jgi:hypothetical protein